MFTVKTALEKLARYNGAGGSCWDDPSNLDRLNEALELIFERDDYAGTTEWGCLECVDDCFYLPWHLETIRDAYVGKSPMPVFNHHYMALDSVKRASDCATRTHAYFISTGIRRPIVRTPHDLFRVGVQNDDPADDGTAITLKMRRDGHYEWVTLTLNHKKVVWSDNNFHDVLEATKPLTEGWVKVVGHCQTGEEGVLANYPPYMENPAAQQFRLENRCCSGCDYIVTFAKKVTPSFTEDDYDKLVPITSIRGLSFAYQALNKQDNDDDQGYTNKILLMENQLEHAQRNLESHEGMVEAGNVYYQRSHDPRDEYPTIRHCC